MLEYDSPADDHLRSGIYGDAPTKFNAASRNSLSSFFLVIQAFIAESVKQYLGLNGMQLSHIEGATP